MAIVNISDADFEDKVLKSQLPVLVDFWATWCGPCKASEPVLEELANVYAGKVVILKIDVDANNEMPSKYGVMSIPTTILFKDGKEMGRQVGFSGKQSFEDLIKKAL